jgi:hypothetical protein
VPFPLAPNVVPDDTVALRGVEHHTFVCSAGHVTEHRVVFVKDGRETDSPPMPMQATRRVERASTEQDEHVAAPGLLGRVMALIRGQVRHLLLRASGILGS